MCQNQRLMSLYKKPSASSGMKSPTLLESLRNPDLLFPLKEKHSPVCGRKPQS